MVTSAYRSFKAVSSAYDLAYADETVFLFSLEDVYHTVSTQHFIRDLGLRDFVGRDILQNLGSGPSPTNQSAD